jgi:hypothetical protein
LWHLLVGRYPQIMREDAERGIDILKNPREYPTNIEKMMGIGPPGLPGDPAESPSPIPQPGGEYGGPGSLLSQSAYEHLLPPAPLSYDSGMSTPIGDKPVYQDVGPPSREDHRDKMWADFLAQNPNLDLEAVRQQAGGTPGGGTLSEPTVDPDLPYEQTDKGVQEWLAGDARRAQAERMLDKKRRGYDPGAAEKILADLAAQEAAKIEAAKNKVAGRRADAEVMQAEAYKSLADRGLSASGYPFGGTQSGDTGDLLKAIKELRNLPPGNMTPEEQTRLEANLSHAVTLIGLGRIEEARKILSMYAPESPVSPPPGVAELAEGEGSEPVPPVPGSKMKWDEKRKVWTY